MRDAPFEAEEDPFGSGDGEVGADILPDLIDTSVPEAGAQLSYRNEQHPAASPDGNGYRDAHSPAGTASSSSPAAVGSGSGREASARQMASVSLDEMVNRGLAREDGPTPAAAASSSQKSLPLAGGPSPAAETKVPEMQERGGATSPFLLQGSGGSGKKPPAAMMDMELDDEKVALEDGTPAADDH